MTRPVRKASTSGKPAVRLERLAAIFKNGRNQAVRLPQDLRFPEGVNEVVIHREGRSLVLTPARPDWGAFFAANPADSNFLRDRQDPPPERRKLFE